MRELLGVHQRRRFIEADQIARPGQDGYVGDGVLIAHYPGVLGVLLVKHVEQPARFVHIALQGALVFNDLASKFIEKADLLSLMLSFLISGFTGPGINSFTLIPYSDNS